MPLTDKCICEHSLGEHSGGEPNPCRYVSSGGVVCRCPSFATAELTFQRLNKVNRTRANRWHPGFPHSDDKWSGADWSNAMCGEAGEAANVVKKMRRVECDLALGPNDPIFDDLVRMLGDELADTIIYADLLATFYGIDLTAAIVRKFNRISERQDFPERL